MDHSMASGFKPGLGSAVWSPDLTPMSEPQYIGALIGLFILSIGFRALVAAQGYLEAYLHLHYYPRPSSHSSSSSRGLSSSSYQQQQRELLNPAGDAMGGDSDDDEEGNGRQQQQQQHLGGSDGTGVARPFSSLPNAEKNDPLLQQGQGVLQPHQQQTSSNTPSRRHKHYGSQLHHHSPPPFYTHETSTPLSLPFLTFPTAQPFIWQAEVSRALLTTAVIGIGYMLMLVIMTYNSAYLGVILVGVFVGEVYFARWGRVRPVFPSTPEAGRPSRSMEIKQPQQSSEGTTSGATVSRTAALSTTSLASSTSSHGYSTTMAHHGLSGDGSC